MDPVTIAIANHKGGVGKTTTAHSLGRALSERGYNILLVDMDPQSSLSEGCGISQEKSAGHSLADVLGGAKPGNMALKDILVKVGERLTLAPANIDMSITELGLAARLVGRDRVLTKTLAPVKGDYDFVLVDAPPSLGMLVINSLTASDYVIVPTQPQVVDLRGLLLFRDTLDQLRNGDGRPHELGVLLTFFDPRFTLHKAAHQAMLDAGMKVFHTTIGRSVKVAESPEYGKSILDYAPGNPRANEYRQLAEEVLTCLSPAVA